MNGSHAGTVPTALVRGIETTATARSNPDYVVVMRTRLGTAP